MTEFELKLEVPANRADDVANAFEKVRPVRLTAQYFDTAESDLARKGVVVRVRREGGLWVQTAKASSDKALERFEHNVKLPRLAAGAKPAIELSRHAGTPLEPRIREALGLREGEPFPPLQAVFETDVRRQILNVRTGRSVVEVAFDRGKVVAADRSRPLCEVEFELKSGSPQAAIALAQRWAARYGLWLSSVSKSAKGRRLAENSRPAATLAQPIKFDAAASLLQAQAAMLHNCLDQVLANGSDVADGSTDGEQIHQLRVGLRRLRTVLHEVTVPHHPVNPAWEPELAKVFRALGKHRDQGFLVTHQQPQLEAAGGPALEMHGGEGLPSPLQCVRAAGFQRTLMDLLAYVHREKRETSVTGQHALATIRARLKKLHRSLIDEGEAFVTLDEDAQHRVRKQLKRFRYLTELSVPLFDGKKVRRFLKRLKPIQDSLGEYNDGLTALRAYRKLAQTEPLAWFGVGWLSAGQASKAATCQRDLKALRKQKTFW